MSKLYEKMIKSRPSFSPMQRELRSLTAEVTRQHPGGDNLKQLFRSLDITSLSSLDTESSIYSLCTKVRVVPKRFPGTPAAAAVCVYPAFTRQVSSLLSESGVRTAVVAGSFPSAQTFREILTAEVSMAAGHGADEIDVVMPPGLIKERYYDEAANIVKDIRKAAGNRVLKVIIESGVLADPAAVYSAAVIAMEAGADFVKSSTGKEPVSATPEAAWVICSAIKRYHEETGIKVGFKAAGGISDPGTALLYRSITASILGDHWLGPDLFRIGASRLANAILSSDSEESLNYF